jgi:putative IMPACT (imprinted ancient) family translation regulator
VQSRDEVEAFRSSILMDKRCQRATHNIMAYRFVDPVTRLVCSDCDDDGESAAGGRLAEMIRLMGCDGVVAIVSRWFGGTLLGPDRFKLINNTARSLLEAHGYGGKDREKGKKHENCSTYLRGGGQSNKKGSRHDR